MRVAVIGASGRTGVHVLEQAQRRGHQVRAVVRNAAKLKSVVPQSLHNRLEVAVADAEHTDALAHALRGVDVVVVALGPDRRSASPIMRSGMETIAAAMRANSLTRVVAISAAGLPSEGDDPINRFVAKPLLQRVFRDLYADLAAMDAFLADSDLRWTVVRPPRLTNGSSVSYVQRWDRAVLWRGSASRRATAAALLDAAENDDTIGHRISIAN